MKKITVLCLLICALANNNNVFGMLTKTSPIRKIILHKNIKSFHARDTWESKSCYCAPENCICTEKKQKNKQIIVEKADLNNSVQENHKLLNKIIQQNKENNLLLRTIVKQNYVYTRKGFSNKKEFQKYLEGCVIRSDFYIRQHKDVLEHYDMLKKQYGIDVTYELE